MSLLSNSVKVLSTSLKSTGGEPTTYRRSNDSLQITGVPVRVRHDVYGDEETQLTARERDWIYLAEDLTHDGERWEPQRGDEIDYIDVLGVKHTFQVLPRLDDRCYRHTDPTLTLLRIYTVERIPNSE